MSNWLTICHVDDIPAGTGLCALVNEQQVAVFRPDDSGSVFAISNMDPFANANVLSRGLIAQHQDELWVASPLKKQRFNLSDGRCLENSEMSVKSYPARVRDGNVEIADSAAL
ncbi:nitrite reductase small subunit NirD [Echinimonas agarilytica]|uniref:Nitrite reductase (NADH) small subunit n=1 Tax=Echinimonas agarilytica TaxID=1215918 RepID=A0AA42B7Q0_9GAMM|nr:nitrite reductase small subunit NirD [Echinimonas agarilytica]MCM2680002.1 nitrite reductase small subunit NirD [Echinimonas agarilytica]